MQSISQKPFYIIPWNSLKCYMRLNSFICLILLTSLSSEEPLKGHNWSTVVGDPVRQIMRACVFPSLNYAPCGRPSFSTAADWECCATQPVLHIHNEHHTDPRVTLRDAPTVLLTVWAPCQIKATGTRWKTPTANLGVLLLFNGSL